MAPVPDGGPPRYDPSKPNGLGQQAPLTPEAQAKLEASLKDQDAGGQGLDVTYKCIPTAMPRMMSGVFPHEFVFTPDTTFMLFEFMINSPRRIYTEGALAAGSRRPHLRRLLDRQMARYRRRRPLRRLDVETRNIRTPHTFDQAGIPFSDDGNGVVTERFFLDKANPDILHVEMTTDRFLR